MGVLKYQSLTHSNRLLKRFFPFCDWCRYAEFLDTHPGLANFLFSHPKELLPLFDKACRKAQVSQLWMRIYRSQMQAHYPNLGCG